MDTGEALEIFLVCAPGMESVLADEARALGFGQTVVATGGVTLRGGWPDVWRANLCLRCASRVLVRIGAFRAMHLAQLDKRARRFPWADTLRADVAIRIETTCKASRIYHAGAASQRIATAIAETLGAPIRTDAELVLKARIEDDLCTFSIDTSGDALHKRGHKGAVGKAPLRETLAAGFLRQMGFDGREPLVDPMCGSGTFVIEAAEIATGLLPGRSRGFAFEHLASFDPETFAGLRGTPPRPTDQRFYGFDRDDGAIRTSIANAELAGVASQTAFARAPVSDLTPPDGPPGLVMVNPPYGARIGERKLLFAVYGALGKVLLDRFAVWRVGLITSDAGLARATGLPFAPPGPPVAHGGLRVQLFATPTLRRSPPGPS